MKRLTLFTSLFVLFALSITLPKTGFPSESPKIEKANLKRDFTEQRYMYLFDFDFVNALAQPIEISSVNVFDMNGRRVEQDWVASGQNWDIRLLTHALSGNHPLVKIISKPRGTPLEQATVSPVGDRIEINVTNRILSAGEAIRPSLYVLSSKNKYDSLVLRITYRVNGNLQEVSHTFTTGLVAPSAPVPLVNKDDLNKALECGLSAGLRKLNNGPPEAKDLYKAIKATLMGRNLAENRRLLQRAAIQFGLDIAPLGACFKPIFFPDQAGGGAPPATPTNLIVSPNPVNGTVMQLEWQDHSYDEWSFQVSNGNESRSAPASPGTGTVEYTWTGLKPGSWTCFRVRANNGDMFSNWEPNASPWWKCAYSSRRGTAR